MAVSFSARADVPPQGGTLSKRQLSALMKDAHSDPQYRRLAGYFAQEADRYDMLASTAEQELQRELAHPSYGSKHPNAAERAHRWYEFYSEQAKLMRDREMEYKRKLTASETAQSSSIHPR